METTFIYALNDPEMGQCRYVGKANNPKIRLRCHLSESKNGGSYRNNWINSLAVRGLTPALEILDEVLASEWPQWEVAYVEFFQEQGASLTNGNPGGEGMHNPTPEVRAKMSKPKSAEWRAKMRKPKSPEHRAKISASKTGSKLSIETRAKISAANNRPERLAKSSADAKIWITQRQRDEKGRLI